MILKSVAGGGGGSQKTDKPDAAAVDAVQPQPQTAEAVAPGGDGDVDAALVEATRRELRNRVPRRVPIVELNEHLTCYLCKGYFIDATTIIECLHSFCRSCIVTYLASNKYCPVCDVQVHKTKPLLNIRPDKTLQDITYKLVPKLFQNELQKRREYYTQHPDAKPSQLETRAETTYQHLLTPDEMLCISLLYDGAPDTCTPRYLRCSASVSMAHLQKLIRNKYDLSPLHRVEILHQSDALAAYLTLIDVAYIYLWRRKVPLALTYRIYENIKKTTLETTENNNNNRSEKDDDGVGEDSNWKEVQLRISENGEMSVTGIQDCLSLLDANILEDQQHDEEKNAQVHTPSKKLKLDRKHKDKEKEKEKDKEAKDKTDKGKKDKPDKRETRSALQVKTNTNQIPDKDKIKEKTKAVKIPKDRKRKSIEISEHKEEKTARDEDVVKKAKFNDLPPVATSVASVTTNTKTSVSQSTTTQPQNSGLQNLSKNHPLKKHSLAHSNGSAKNTTATVTSATVTSSSVCTTTHVLSQKTERLEERLTPLKQVHHYNYTPPMPGRVYTPPGCTPSGYTPLVVPNSSNTMRPYIPPGAHQHQQSRFRMEGVPRHGWGHRGPPAQLSGASSVPVVPTGSNHGKHGSTGTSKVSTTGSGIPSTNPGKPTTATSPSGTSQGKSAPTPTIGTPGRTGTPPAPSAPDLRNVRPAKFFKMRNNMPRYLGCPASGVKPMYMQESQSDTSKDDPKNSKEVTTDKKDKPKAKEPKIKETPKIEDKSSIEVKQPIVKIDPKTLKPIQTSSDKVVSSGTTTSSSNRTSLSGPSQVGSLTTSTSTSTSSSSTITAPSTSTITTSIAQQQDLKINTSSVSIFNPMKLQSERKSPHSPGGKRSERPAMSPGSNTPISTTAPTMVPSTSNGTNNGPSGMAGNGSHGNGNGTTGSSSSNVHPVGHSPGGIMPMSPTTMGMLHHAHHGHKNHKPSSAAAAAASLGYTPPNPFVPNLTASGMSPGGFMYSSPSFPYDPMMAAFLAYSRPSFNYDFHKMQMGQMPMGQLNQMGYGMPGCHPSPSPSRESPSQSKSQSPSPSPSSKKEKSEKVPQTRKTPTNQVAANKETKHDQSQLSNQQVKESKDKEKEAIKDRKESPTHGKTSNKTTKSEKTLQNALDKLTKAKMADGNDTSVIPKTEGKLEVTQGHKPMGKPNKVEIQSDITITPSKTNHKKETTHEVQKVQTKTEDLSVRQETKEKNSEICKPTETEISSKTLVTTKPELTSKSSESKSDEDKQKTKVDITENCKLTKVTSATTVTSNMSTKTTKETKEVKTTSNLNKLKITPTEDKLGEDKTSTSTESSNTQPSTKESSEKPTKTQQENG